MRVTAALFSCLMLTGIAIGSEQRMPEPVPLFTDAGIETLVSAPPEGSMRSRLVLLENSLLQIPIDAH